MSCQGAHLTRTWKEESRGCTVPCSTYDSTYLVFLHRHPLARNRCHSQQSHSLGGLRGCRTSKTKQHAIPVSEADRGRRRRGERDDLGELIWRRQGTHERWSQRRQVFIPPNRGISSQAELSPHPASHRASGLALRGANTPRSPTPWPGNIRSPGRPSRDASHGGATVCGRAQRRLQSRLLSPLLDAARQEHPHQVSSLRGPVLREGMRHRSSRGRYSRGHVRFHGEHGGWRATDAGRGLCVAPRVPSCIDGNGAFCNEFLEKHHEHLPCPQHILKESKNLP